MGRSALACDLHLGKRWFRTDAPAKVEEAKPLYKEGDILFKYVGKNLVREIFRAEALPTEVAKAHECSWRVQYVGKNVQRTHFCKVYGAEKACPGMNAAGECLAVGK